jgi:hypothetical protein
MPAWFNLKMLGSAALALGISTVSLWPEMASANIVFDFSGTCDLEGCPATTDTATGVLTLTDDYVYGTNMTLATFVSFTYSSNDSDLLFAPITKANVGFVQGGLNSDGSFSDASFDQVSVLVDNGRDFTALPGDFFVRGDVSFHTNGGTTFTFTNVTPPPAAVPEPSTWAMMALGFAGLGFMGWRSRKTSAVA